MEKEVLVNKFISSIIIIAVMLSVVACGQNEDDGGLHFNGGAITRREDESTEQSETTEVSIDTTAVTEENTSESAASAIETEGAVPEVRKEFAPGKVSGTKYENDFVGIGCKLGSGWEFYSETEIQELNNFYAVNVDEKYSDFLYGIDSFCDMSAANKDSGSSVEVNLDKADPEELYKLDMIAYCELQAPLQAKICEELGYKLVTHSVKYVSVGDNILPCIKISGKNPNGLKLYFLYFFVKCDGYIATVNVTTAVKDTTESIVNKFYAT